MKAVYVSVFDRPTGKAILAWYIAPGLSPNALGARLESRLPPYMVPALLVPLEAFPLNLSGKIDRGRLTMSDPTALPVEARPLDGITGSCGVGNRAEPAGGQRGAEQ